MDSLQPSERYTWYGRKRDRDAEKGLRLDYFFLKEGRSMPLAEVQECTVRRATTKSDHQPVVCATKVLVPATEEASWAEVVRLAGRGEPLPIDLWMPAEPGVEPTDDDMSQDNLDALDSAMHTLASALTLADLGLVKRAIKNIERRMRGTRRVRRDGRGTRER